MTAVALQTDNTVQWKATLPHVRKALSFIKRKGHVTAAELVDWDRTHGQRLFDWNDPEAAEEWRRQQARNFLNRFRAQFEGMRVRAFIHVRENEAQGIDESGYFTVQAIAEHQGMREQVINDITKRMANLAAELKMWSLTDVEQAALFARLHEALNGPMEHRKTA